MDFKMIKERLLRFFDKENIQNSGRNLKELSPFSYWDRILELCGEYPENKSLYVEYRHIRLFDPELADELIHNPEIWLEAATEAVEKLTNDKMSISQMKDVAVRITGLPDEYEVPISKLRKHHLGKFLAVRCTISKATKVEPAYETCAFQCLRCGHVTIVPQSKDSDMLQEPYAGCEDETCGKRGPFKRDDKSSAFFDHQYLKVQEPLESLRGRQPEYLYVSCADDLAGASQPGDKVIISGVLKGRLKMKQQGVTRFNELFLVANSITKSDRDFENLVITPEEEQKILDLARSGKVAEIVYASIAPSIFGLGHVKKGIALQLFSGLRTFSEDGTATRGDIHILLIGDPGIAKSQLLKYVSLFAPRAIMVSGRSASGGGLTGVAVHDEFDKKWAIEGGAMTIVSGSDKIEGGICCIDEMDKMSEKDRSAIHSALEQQCVDIAKAGLFAHLPTVCGCLGAANPKYGRYNPYESIASQFNLSDTLLSRMDLLFVLRDTVDEEVDAKLAVHVLSGKKSTVDVPILDSEFLRKYIAYAKIHCKPEMTTDAVNYIASFYVQTRKAGSKARDSVSVTVRALESAKRLAVAHAKMRLSQKVEILDAKAACDLLLENLSQVGIDPDTGTLDASVIISGTSSSQRQKIHDLKIIISKLSKANILHQSANLADIKTHCSAKGIEEVEVDTLLNKMKRKGDVFFPTINSVKLVVPYTEE